MMPTPKQQEEMAQLKRWMPYRIIYGALHPDTKEWRVDAVTTMRRPKKLAREGWQVWIYGSGLDAAAS